MKVIQGKRVAAEKIDGHAYICDLVNVEFPLLSLYSDGRWNWLYLWADTDSEKKHRWIIFTATRKALLEYLDQEVPLASLLESARLTYLLDKKETYRHRPSGIVEKENSNRYLRRVSLQDITDYRPSDDSYFDPLLTDDLDLTKQLQPASYVVPIDGVWFGKDFESFFKSYEKIYAFFYATKPRFVRTVSTRLSQLLRAPWTGGFSRVNLYASLAKNIPAVHALRVDRMKFASPGDISFEALPSIGASIHKAALAYLGKVDEIEEAVKQNRTLMTDGRLNKEDLSQRSDDEIDLAQAQLDELAASCLLIAKHMGIKEEIQTLREHSPNTVVFAKAVNSLVKQMRYVASLQDEGMLELDREATTE